MKRRFIALCGALVFCGVLMSGCGGHSKQADQARSSDMSAGAEAVSGHGDMQEKTGVGHGDISEEADAGKEGAGESGSPRTAEDATVLPDGEYSAQFHTDSNMFHVNEACDGRGTLTVEDGEMTIHISLVSKNIVNLYSGLSEDAKKAGAELIEPTEDTVTYSDGMEEEVYGFDVPVPALDEDFDVAIIGKKGKWYDHRVSVSDPQPLE